MTVRAVGACRPEVSLLVFSIYHGLSHHHHTYTSYLLTDDNPHHLTMVSRYLWLIRRLTSENTLTDLCLEISQIFYVKLDFKPQQVYNGFTTADMVTLYNTTNRISDLSMTSVIIFIQTQGWFRSHLFIFTVDAAATTRFSVQNKGTKGLAGIQVKFYGSNSGVTLGF